MGFGFNKVIDRPSEKIYRLFIPALSGSVMIIDEARQDLMVWLH